MLAERSPHVKHLARVLGIFVMERPQSSTIPTTPGVYLYRDEHGRVIYVGKARQLRNRILSYFRDPESLPRKTLAMLSHAVSLETLSTGTEKEALLLESSLIRKHRPHYNIVLRDDKQYVLFRLARNEPYPRLEIVRRTRRDKARYFGPFTSGLAARETWKAVHRAFPLRRCTDRAMQNRVRPCLYYDLGQCLAPCTKEVDPAAYGDLVQRVEMLLSGRSRKLLQTLGEAMQAASDALEFEKAAVLRDQIRAVERTVERQSVVLSGSADMDVAGVAPVRGGLGLGLLFVREGKLMDGRTFFWPGLELADGPELVWSFLGQFYSEMAGSVPARIVVPWPAPKEPEQDAAEEAGAASEEPSAAQEHAGGLEDGNAQPLEETSHGTEFAHEALEALLTELRGEAGMVRIRLPRDADERALVDMAASNACEAVLKRVDEPLPDRLCTALQAATPIRRVECVDVSHTGGCDTRVGMVVFEDGRPSKPDYRTYAMENTNGDDYAALSQWAVRRMHDGPPWADLVLIDGGRGQIAAVLRAFKQALQESQASGQPLEAAGPGGLPFVLAGIAKARDEEGRADRRAGNVRDRIFLPGRSNPLPLKEGSSELLFLQHVRDTAHHFALGRHRRAHAGAALEGELTRIPGIGPAMARRLWEAFGTFENMLAATEAELSKVPGVGPVTARRLAEKFRRLRDSRKQSPGR